MGGGEKASRVRSSQGATTQEGQRPFKEERAPRGAEQGRLRPSTALNPRDPLAKRQQRREERAGKLVEQQVEDVSVFPMAMPMLAGPGAIAAVMLLQNEAEGYEGTMVVLGALVSVLLITMIALIAAGPLIRLLGARVEAVITRLLGVLLAALAAQYVIDGLRGSFGL